MCLKKNNVRRSASRDLGPGDLDPGDLDPGDRGSRPPRGTGDNEM